MIPICKNCKAKLGEHHKPDCEYWGQVVPSETFYEVPEEPNENNNR